MNAPEKAATPPTITVENVQLEHFESLVYSRQYEEAGRELLRNLKRLKVGGEFAGHVMHEESRPRLYTRFAAAVTALLADPAFQLSQEGFDLLAVEHATFQAVFQASAFGNADHLLRQFGTVDPNEPGRLHFTSPQNVVKLLLAYSLDSELDIDFEHVFRAAPRLALPAFLGMLAHIVVISPRAHARREKLLTLGPLFEQVELREHMLAAMSDAYMYCTYATADTKHEIKRSFNVMMRRLIESQIRLPQVPAERRLKERPTVLVPIEWFTSLHAMYRCYAPSIRQLRERFRIVMIGRSSEMDEVSKQVFDETIEISGANVALSDVVEQIRRVDADMVYYPSVGMATWWVALSTIRLAPIQMFSMGHPATTMSPVMDYVLPTDGFEGDPSCYSEIAVIEPAHAVTYEMRSDALFPEPVIRERPEVLRIAIPSMACKVSSPFMETLARIRGKASRRVEFHFFPNMVGLTWAQITREIRRWIPDAIVYPRSDYRQYIANLVNCDLHLSTFPFGGTNSNIDSMKLALPIVTLEGLDTHSRTDAAMIRMCNLPDSTIAYNEAEYERLALRLIENDEERVRIARQLRGVDMNRLFFSKPVASRSFVELFWKIYQNHERILGSGRRYWQWQQLCEYTAT
jgi:hypothetical protein